MNDQERWILNAIANNVSAQEAEDCCHIIPSGLWLVTDSWAMFRAAARLMLDKVDREVVEAALAECYDDEDDDSYPFTNEEKLKRAISKLDDIYRDVTSIYN
jgi:hypothetical protein